MTTFEYYKRRFNEWWYDTKNGIKALWYWIPIIWHDRNYDNRDIWKLLYHKIKRKRKYFETHMHMRYVGIEKDIERMKRIEYVLSERMLKHGEYNRLAGKDKHDERWGEMDWHFEPAEEYGEGYSTLVTERPNVNTEQDKKRQSRQLRQIYKRAKMLRDQDEWWVLKQIRKYSDNWWV